MKQEQIYKAALERILFHLKDIYDTDLSTESCSDSCLNPHSVIL